MALRQRWNRLGAASAAALLLQAACGGETPKPPSQPAADTTPAAPASRLGEVAGWDKTPVGEANAKDLVALADALVTEGTPDAVAASVRLRLIAVAALGAKPAAGFDAAAQLGLARVGSEKAGPDGARLRTAAQVLEQTLALSAAQDGSAGLTREPFDGDAALALLDGPGSASIEADVVRLAARRALQALDTLAGTPEAFAEFCQRYGAFACGVCAAAGGVTGGTEAVVPCPPSDASPTCKALTTLAGTLPAVGEAPNRVVIALLERLGPVADQPLGHVGLARSVELPARPRWVGLPLQFERAQLPVVGGAATPAGFNASEPRLVAPVTPAGLGLGHRATVGAGGTSPGIADGRLATQYTATYADLVAPASEAPLAGEAATRPDLRKRLASLIPDGPAPDEVTVLVGLHPETRAAEAAAALDALRAIQLGHFRFAGAHAASPVPTQTPLLVREGAGVTPAGAALATEVPAGLEQGWRGDALVRLRVALPPVTLSADAPKPDAAPADAPKPDAAPADAPKPVLRMRLDDGARDAVLSAVAFFRQKTGAGAFVHVTAAPELSAGLVVDLARAVQEAPAPAGVATNPASADPGSVWLGTRCEGPANCPATLALAFSTSPVPGDRGLTPRPGEAAAEGEKLPTVVVAPPPSEENCDRADINAVMRRNTGRFRFCYEKELQLTKDLGGKASVVFTIGFDGKVSGVSTGGDLPSKAVLECLGREVGKLSFAPPNGGPCQIRWPFVFKPE